MKRLIIVFLVILCSVPAFSQGHGQRPDREQIKAARVAFLTNRLDLDTEQAQKFWPIFNEYEKEKGDLSSEYNDKKRELIGVDGFRNMSDENAMKMLDIYLDQKEAELKLERKYIARFKDVLNPKQTWAMVRFEGDFRRSVLDKMMKRRDENSNNRSRPDKDGGN